MLAPVEGVKLLVAFEAVLDAAVGNPLLLGAERCLDDLLHLFVHFHIHHRRSTIINPEGVVNTVFDPNNTRKISSAHVLSQHFYPRFQFLHLQYLLFS